MYFNRSRQLAEKKPARARNKSCAAKVAARGGAEHTFVISQEIASCEIKSLRQDAQLAEKKPARARNKSCAAKAVARGGCEAHFFSFTGNCVL